MVRMFVRHQVSDYPAFRKVYDAFPREAKGVTGAAVYRSVDDGNDITVSHDFESAEAAKTFAGSAELRSAMQEAGVEGPPTIWFVEEA